MIQVVYSDNDLLSVKEFELFKSTVARNCGCEMTFCYYQEVDQQTVFTGLQSVDRRIKVFVKLIDNEPVDLSITEWLEQWNRFPEWIPDDI
jgi:hypothetical protein